MQPLSLTFSGQFEKKRKKRSWALLGRLLMPNMCLFNFDSLLIQISNVQLAIMGFTLLAIPKKCLPFLLTLLPHLNHSLAPFLSEDFGFINPSLKLLHSQLIMKW
jgi:hypothetical protein